jgi:parvulin-like peptidyl-prolyl isomerase
MELAKQHSDDEDSAPAGGMMGWYEVAKMPQEFQQAIRGLDTGDVSSPFLSDFGAHVILVEELQEKRAMSLEADWDRIETMAKNRKRERKFQEWVAKLRQQVYIDTTISSEATP